MKVDVLLFAAVKDACGRESLRVELDEGTRVSEAIGTLRRYPAFTALEKLPLLFAVNEEFVQEDTVLRDSDVLAVMTPVSGGA